LFSASADYPAPKLQHHRMNQIRKPRIAPALLAGGFIIRVHPCPSVVE